MADVTIKYRGSIISTMSASGTKTLQTEGKYCDSDIDVEYDKPAGIAVETNKEATPSESTQIIEPSDGYDALEQVTINPIPTNYGKITWDGTTLTIT